MGELKLPQPPWLRQPCLIEVNTHYSPNTTSNEDERTVTNNFEVFNYFHESIDWVKFTEAVGNIPWESEFQNLSPEQQLDKFMKYLLHLSELYVPKRKYFIKNQNKNHSRIPRERRILMRKRRKLIKKIQNTFSTKIKNEIKEQLISIELELQISYSESKKARETRAVNAIKTNAKYFYSYAKKNSKHKSRVGPLFNKKLN